MFTRNATIELLNIAQGVPKEKQNILLEELRQSYHNAGHKKELTATDVRTLAFDLGILKEATKPKDEDEY